MQVVPTPMSGGLEVCDEAGSRGGKVGNSLLHERGLEHPAHEVPAFELARPPGGSPASYEHLPACFVQLFCDLTTGLTAAHHQDHPRRQLLRIR
jgi:hypothetical protein